MNIQKRRTFETTVFSAAFALISLAAPVLAAPTDAPLSVTPVVKVTTATPLLKPTAVKTLVPIVPPAAKSGRALVKRRSDYRYSNPTRWHSDMTANSIRNQ